MGNVREYVLEPSTNTHKIKAENIFAKDVDNNTIKLKLVGDGILTHGKEGKTSEGTHGTLRIESPNVVKYTQEEYNPVTNELQIVFD